MAILWQRGGEDDEERQPEMGMAMGMSSAHLATRGVEVLADIMVEEVEIGDDNVVLTLPEVAAYLAKRLGVCHAIGSLGEDYTLLHTRHDAVSARAGNKG